MELKHFNIKIHGKVQGVSFRMFAKENARALGLKGFVENLPEGTVYIEVEGEEAKLNFFLDLCNKGPAKAEVENLEQDEGFLKNYEEFSVNYYLEPKEKFVQRLIRKGVLKSSQVIKAFENVDRQDFLTEKHKTDAYIDSAFSIGHNVTISQPYTVAFMLELLHPKKGEIILDIGCGSCWTTAMLAEIVGDEGKVYGTDIIPEIIDFGKTNLEKYEFSNIEIIQKTEDEPLGHPEKSPFDRILVSAAAHEKPKDLIDQLKVGGRLVMPIKDSVWKIDKISDTETKEDEFEGFIFVPLKARI